MGKNLGLDISANLRHTSNGLQSKDIEVEQLQMIGMEVSDSELNDLLMQGKYKTIDEQVYSKAESSEEFSSVTFGGVSATAKYKHSIGSIGLGVEAGYKNERSHIKGEAKNYYYKRIGEFNGDIPIYSNQSWGPEINEYTNRNSFIVAPKIEGNLNLGKGCLLKAGAILGQEANISFRKTF